MIPLLLCVFAQADLTFEVASIKPAGPLVMGQKTKSGGPGTSEPGRVTFTHVPLSYLLAQAYDVWDDQVAGPSWISEWSNAFTIVATMSPTATPEQYRVMLQNLLAERFGVRVHHERRTRPGYELVVADGGPRMEEWKPGTTNKADFPRMPAGLPRARTLSWPMAGGLAPVHFRVRDTMEGFARGLGSMINISDGVALSGPRARIVDRTGLAGTYDFELEFTGVVRPAETADAAASEPGPTVFYAVEKQLGLKLRKVKEVPVDVVVVDAAEKVPTAN